MIILIAAAIGGLVSMLLAYMILPKPQPPQQLRVRVAVSDDVVLVGIKQGDDATLLRIDREAR